MKKSFKIFSVLMGLILTLAFSGCELMDRAKELVGPTEKWFSYTYDYTFEGKTTVKFYGYIIYVSKDGGYTTNELKLPSDETRFPGGKLKKGLTIVAMPKAETSAEKDAVQAMFGLSSTDAVNKMYAIKTFEEGEQFAMSNDDDQDSTTNDKKFTMGYYVWAGLYNSVHLGSASLPSPIKNSDASNYLEFTDINKFNWKKMLAGLALSYIVNSEYLED